MHPSQLIPTLIECFTKTQLTPMILGAPGIGKTQIIKQIAEHLGWPLFLSHPSTDDPVDYKGMPWFNKETHEALFYPIGIVNKIFNCKEDAIWFIDDVSMAPPSVIAAILQLIDPYGRQLNEQVVPPNVRIVLASNRATDRAGSHTPIEPFKSRVHPITLDPHAPDWIDWAIENDIEPSLIAYVKWRPENLNNFEPSNDWVISPSSRGFQKLSDVMKMDIKDREAKFDWYAGAVGKGVGSEVLAFQETYQNLPTRAEVDSEPELAPLPNELSEQYAMSMFLASTTNAENLNATITYIGRMAGEFVQLWTELMPKYEPELTETAEFTNHCIAIAGDVTL